MSETRPDEYPDGSVGHYVRERWAAQQRTRDEEPAQEQRQDAPHPGLGARRDEAWGVVPDDGAWGSDVLELDGELDLDDSRQGWQGQDTPPHGTRYADAATGWPAAGEQAERERAAQEQAEAARREQERVAREQAERAWAEQQRVEQERAAYVRAEQERAAYVRAEQERVERARLEHARLEQERVEQQRAEQARIQEQRAEQQRAEQARVEQASVEQERVEQARVAEEQRRAQEQWAQRQRVEEQRAEQQRLAEQARVAEEQRLTAQAEQQRLEQQNGAAPNGRHPVAQDGSALPDGSTTVQQRVDEQQAGRQPWAPRQRVPERPADNPTDAAAEQDAAPSSADPGRPALERTVVDQGDRRTPPAGLPTGPGAPIRDVGRWTDPGAVAAQEAQRARTDESEVADLSTARLLKPNRRRAPRTGWRRWLYLLSGRTINPGEGPQEIRERELSNRINQPLLGCHKIATLSLKGGVGKTTITATLGATFASLRGDRVVAVDANPDRGTLSQKIPLETSATVRHLLRDSQRVRRYTDVRAYTSQGPSRLEVLASEQDPAVSEAFSENDYRRTVTLLEHFYNIVLTDCGTGLMHSAMYGVLGVADQLIIVSSGSIDGARSASATMDWLEAHDHGDLVRNAVAVINNVHRQAGAVDLERVAQHFAGRCRAVIQIPFDPHLEEGAEVDLDRLSVPTRLALLDLAASVADGFPS